MLNHSQLDSFVSPVLAFLAFAFTRLPPAHPQLPIILSRATSLHRLPPPPHDALFVRCRGLRWTRCPSPLIMSINSIQNAVLIIANPEWNAGPVPTAAYAPPNISYTEHLSDNFQTLSTKDADNGGWIQGLVYVPDLDSTDDCVNLTAPYIPSNATRRANLPPTDFNLVALAPWVADACTFAFLESAQHDPVRALLFFQPNTLTPPSVDSGAWDLGDGGAWKNDNHYPVYAIPGDLGARMMQELSLYSGNVTAVPDGHDLIEIGVDPRDYVRVHTSIETSYTSTSLDIWVFVLIVVGALLVVTITSFIAMHLIQRSQRESLRRRIMRGDVNLEALGITRWTVPSLVIDRMPLYVYPDLDAEHTLVDSTADRDLHAATDKSPLPVQRPLSRLTGYETVYAHEATDGTATLVQTTCAICLDDYEPGITRVRELPCRHIYHPACIDLVLRMDSSLCPMCKKSVMPPGYCPDDITHAMVRRERALRRLRSRVTITEDGTAHDFPTWHQRVSSWMSRAMDLGMRPPGPPLPPHPATLAMLQAQSQPHLHYQTHSDHTATPQPV